LTSIIDKRQYALGCVHGKARAFKKDAGDISGACAQKRGIIHLFIDADHFFENRLDAFLLMGENACQLLDHPRPGVLAARVQIIVKVRQMDMIALLKINELSGPC